MASRRLPLASGRPTPRVWRVAQVLGVLGLLAVLLGLFTHPDRTTGLFWRGIVPLVPLLLLVHPTIWRNVCPLATLSIPADADWSEPAGAGTGDSEVESPLPFWRPALFLLALIAIRPLGLDASGPASATLLMGLGTVAVLGRSRRRKSGFCNRHCPVLAVERLYGQSPLVEVENARCDGCSQCTARGCLDLSPEAASAQILGPSRRDGGWLRTPLGAFAAVFPGVILAFNILPPNPGVTRVLIGFLGWGLVSGLASILLMALTRIRWQTGFRALGAVSAGLYLGFALPGVAEVWGWPAAGTAAQVAGVALVAGWFLRGSRRRTRLV